LIDLTQVSDEDIRRHGWAAMLELMQKHIRLKDIVPIIKKMAVWGIFKHLEQQGWVARDYIEAMLQ